MSEFYDYVHSQAVLFRNKKRKEYLSGELSKGDMECVERWDCEPSKDLKEMSKRFSNIDTPKKMFNVLYREEPLAIDINLRKNII